MGKCYGFHSGGLQFFSQTWQERSRMRNLLTTANQDTRPCPQLLLSSSSHAALLPPLIYVPATMVMVTMVTL